jgi:hypothetical protein
LRHHNDCIDFQTAHGLAARPFGTAHGRHGTACSAPVPARLEGPCSARAASLAHDTTRARHGLVAARWLARPRMAAQRLF